MPLRDSWWGCPSCWTIQLQRGMENHNVVQGRIPTFHKWWHCKREKSTNRNIYTSEISNKSLPNSTVNTHWFITNHCSFLKGKHLAQWHFVASNHCSHFFTVSCLVGFSRFRRTLWMGRKWGRLLAPSVSRRKQRCRGSSSRSSSSCLILSGKEALPHSSSTMKTSDIYQQKGCSTSAFSIIFKWAKPKNQFFTVLFHVRRRPQDIQKGLLRHRLW